MNSEKEKNKIDLRKWPHISVLIVNFNGKKWLEKFLDPVLNSDYPEERTDVILIDNGSTDGSVEFISRKFDHNPRLKMIKNRENLGWAKAINMGMKVATGEIIACISNDVKVDREWLKEIVNAMNSNPKVGIVQCYSISIWDKKTPDSAMNYLDKFGFAYGYASSGKPTEVTFAEGLAWATKRKVINEIGMLNEDFFMEYDDQDFCWRALLAGHRVVFVPSAIVYHVRGGTQGLTFFHRLDNAAWYTTNHISTLITNYSLENIFKTVPLVIMIDIIKAIWLIAKKRTIFSIKIFKGLLTVVKNLKEIIRKRRIVQYSVRRVSDKEVMRYMVPFSPSLLISFLTSQGRSKRFIIKAKPPLSEGKK